MIKKCSESHLSIYFINVFVARLGSTAGKFGGGRKREREQENEREREKRERVSNLG